MTMSGVQSVEMAMGPWMPELFVDNWDTQVMVSHELQQMTLSYLSIYLSSINVSVSLSSVCPTFFY